MPSRNRRHVRAGPQGRRSLAQSTLDAEEELAQTNMTQFAHSPDALLRNIPVDCPASSRHSDWTPKLKRWRLRTVSDCWKTGRQVFFAGSGGSAEQRHPSGE